MSKGIQSALEAEGIETVTSQSASAGAADQPTPSAAQPPKLPAFVRHA